MRKLLKEWAPVIGLMLVAGVLRFYELGAWPPGLYHDEAFNGLDALRVLAGDHPLYFAANHGREPFFIYLVTLSVSWLGRSVYAVRLPAAIIGLLTIPATYWMARELFGRRVGLLTAAVMTIALWPIQLSLIGLRAGALPFFIALSIAAGVYAYRSRRILAWIVAGLVYGASFYTYLASRFTPFALLAVLIVLIVTGRARRIWPGSAAFIVAAAIVLAPLALTALNQWDVVMGRPGDVSIFNPAINGGDPGGTFVHSLFNALGMFFWRGDRIPRHNVPYRPVFDPLLAVAFGFGLIRLTIGALAATPPPEKPLPDFLQPGTDFRYQVRRRMTLAPKLPSLFTLIWIGVMLLPTILAEDSPHFLRAVGVLPVALIVPAIGLDTVMQWLQSRGWRTLSYIAIAVTLILSAAWTVSDYSRYAADPETGYAFEAAGVDLANQARAEILSGHRIYIADRFVRDWTSVPFLIGGSYENIADGTAPVLNPNQPATLFVWPYEDWTRLFATVAAPLRVKVTAGPQAKGDLDPQTHTGYLAVQIEPKGGADDRPEVEFENGLRLLGHSVEAIDNRHWRLRTLWQTKQTMPGDQTFFVHLLSNNQQVDTSDGDSGDGFYPMRMWRPGDVIVDERIIDIPAQASWQQLLVELGVYDRNTGQRVKVVNSAQPVIDQAILLSGPAPSGPNAIGP